MHYWQSCITGHWSQCVESGRSSTINHVTAEKWELKLQSVQRKLFSATSLAKLFNAKCEKWAGCLKALHSNVTFGVKGSGFKSTHGCLYL